MESSQQEAWSPLLLRFPYALRHSYLIPDAMSDTINRVSEMADCLYDLWFEALGSDLTEDGEAIFPTWVHDASRSIWSHGYAIEEHAHLGRYPASPGVHPFAIAAYEGFEVDRRISPLLILAMLALRRFDNWLTSASQYAQAFSERAIAVLSPELDTSQIPYENLDTWRHAEPTVFLQHLLTIAAKEKLDERLYDLSDRLKDLYGCYHDVKVHAGEYFWPKADDFSELCQLIAACRYTAANDALLPQDEEELEHVMTSVQDWFTEMAGVTDIRTRVNAWENGPFPRLMRGLQGVLYATRPDWAESLDTYRGVDRLIDDGSFTVVQREALVCLRVLLVSRERGLSSGEYFRLRDRLRALVDAVKHDKPMWLQAQAMQAQLRALLEKRQQTAHNRSIAAKNADRTPTVTDEQLIELVKQYETMPSTAAARERTAATYVQNRSGLSKSQTYARLKSLKDMGRI